eukprot:GHRQ01030148.1.p1 GENE.GHRQ01030148.1~~GHRQ01030148.1.p1  ORF type:complete len:177 (+),score=26.80 GHRQ01030148.1:528-1058(+)
MPAVIAHRLHAQVRHATCLQAGYASSTGTARCWGVATTQQTGILRGRRHRTRVGDPSCARVPLLKQYQHLPWQAKPLLANSAAAGHHRAPSSCRRVKLSVGSTSTKLPAGYCFCSTQATRLTVPPATAGASSWRGQQDDAVCSSPASNPSRHRQWVIPSAAYHVLMHCCYRGRQCD